MGFAPQRHALFKYLNFQKRAPATCTCSRPQLPKALWSWSVLPTFWPYGATKHWKNTVFRDFSTFSRTCIFFLLTLSLRYSFFFLSLLWLSHPLLLHLSILSKVWLLNFLRTRVYAWIQCEEGDWHLHHSLLLTSADCVRSGKTSMQRKDPKVHCLLAV